MHPDEDRFTDSQSSATEEFGPYLVYEPLGRGGMATVHRAKKRGIAGYERGVALKRMLPHLAEGLDFINSFVREAKLASLLIHPNIAQIYDFGRIGSVYYIAMEHVDGFDVNKLLRYCHRHSEVPPINVVLSILSELCEALEYAHTFIDESGQPQGIIHRDVSPSNLIVARTGHLKVIDFGIAKANVRQLHTESGRVKGKLGYMSPEVVDARPIGPPSDIFSVGVVAYELLTAKPLFYAKTDYEMLRRVREAEIPPPSERNPSVPASLDRVVLAALERDDRRRLQTAGGLRKALEQVAIDAGIRFSSSDVAEWCAKRGATISDSNAWRESPPSTSRSAARRFPLPAPPGSMSHIYPPPLGVLSGSQRQEHPADETSRRLGTGSLAELGGDPFGDSDAQPPLPLGSVDRLAGELPSPVSAQGGTSPPAPARSRSRTRAVIALGALSAIAAGLAVYQFAVRPTSTIAPAHSAPPLTPSGPASVKFVVQPPDSVVEIGGKEVTRHTPFEVPLERGVYSVAVSHVGYKRWSGQLTLIDPESQTVNVALDQASAVVRLRSQPAGLAVQLDGKPLDQVTPVEFEVAPGPHRLVVVGATGTWPQDFVATADGTYTFHAVLAAKRASTAATTSGVARTTAPARTSQRASSGAAARTPAARDAVIEPEDRDDPGPESPIAKPLPKVDPLPGSTPEPDPTVTSPSAVPRPVPLVPPNSVTRLSGEIPAIQGNGAVDVYSKICIGLDGHVTSVKIITKNARIASELQRTLVGWRYKPYVDAGQPSPACFALNFRLVFEHAR